MRTIIKIAVSVDKEGKKAFNLRKKLFITLQILIGLLFHVDDPFHQNPFVLNEKGYLTLIVEQILSFFEWKMSVFLLFSTVLYVSH